MASNLTWLEFPTGDIMSIWCTLMLNVHLEISSISEVEKDRSLEAASVNGSDCKRITYNKDLNEGNAFSYHFISWDFGDQNMSRLLEHPYFNY